jgi:hypothetical protein
MARKSAEKAKAKAGRPEGSVSEDHTPADPIRDVAKLFAKPGTSRNRDLQELLALYLENDSAGKLLVSILTEKAEALGWIE